MSNGLRQAPAPPVLSQIQRLTIPTPFPVGPVHAYLLEGEPLTLFDTGPNTPEASEALHTGLAQYGYAASDLECIIISHAHSDHFGLVEPLVAASGAQVFAHSLSRPAIEGWDSYYRKRDAFWPYLLQASAVPAEPAARTVALYKGFRSYQSHAPINVQLADGMVLDVAGEPWQVLHCPGHASGLICLYQPEACLLLGNDHVLARISSNAIVEPPPPGELIRRKPLLDYWDSLCRVFDLNLNLVLPGHGAVVANHRQVISERFQFYERRLDRIREALREGPLTVWQLADALFRRLDAVDTFLACSEVIGHLDVLQEKGEVVQLVNCHGEWEYRRQV